MGQIQDFSGDNPSYGQGAAGQIAALIGSLPATAEKQSNQQATDTQNQTKLYFELRQQGYTKEDAADRVNRSYRSTNFVQNMLGGNGNVFQPPTNPDQIEMEQNKAKSEMAAKQAESDAKIAEAKKFSAQANYYNAGGPAQRYAHNDNLTPNQIQTRIKDLRGQLGMGTPEEDADIQNEIGYMNDLFNKKSKYNPGGAGMPKFKVGQTVYDKTGKPVQITKINPDGSYN